MHKQIILLSLLCGCGSDDFRAVVTVAAKTDSYLGIKINDNLVCTNLNAERILTIKIEVPGDYIITPFKVNTPTTALERWVFLPESHTLSVREERTYELEWGDRELGPLLNGEYQHERSGMVNFKTRVVGQELRIESQVFNLPVYLTGLNFFSQEKASAEHQVIEGRISSDGCMIGINYRYPSTPLRGYIYRSTKCE